MIRFSPISTYVTLIGSPGLSWAIAAMAPSSTLNVTCMGFWSTMCFMVTVLAVWSNATSSPARLLGAAAFVASWVAAGVVGLAVWANAGPATAEIATVATARYLNVFIAAPP